MEITEELLDEIEAKAKAATSGPWERSDEPIHYKYGAVGMLHGIRTAWDHPQAKGPLGVLVPSYAVVEGENAFAHVSKEDADHLTRMDPSTTLALVSRIRELESEVRSLEDAMQEAITQPEDAVEILAFALGLCDEATQD